MADPAPVHFDATAAAIVADECRRTSALLGDLTGQRVRLTAAGCDQWQGGNRKSFDDDLHTMSRHVNRISDDLLRVAGDLGRATDVAQVEQRARDLAVQQAQQTAVPDARRGPR